MAPNAAGAAARAARDANRIRPAPKTPAAAAPSTPAIPDPIPVHSPALPTGTPWNRVRNAGRKYEKVYSAEFTIAPDAAIHHIAGILASSIGEPPCVIPPRAASGSHSSAGISTIAGTAATAIAARHPYDCATGPVIAR